MKFASMIDVSLDTLSIGQYVYNSVPQFMGEIVAIYKKPDGVDVNLAGWTVQYPFIKERISHLYVLIEEENIFIKLEKMLQEL